MQDYRDRVTRLQRTTSGAAQLLDETSSRMAAITAAASDTPKASPKLRAEAIAVQAKIRELEIALRGDNTASVLVQPEAPSLVQRVSQVTFSQLSSPIPPSQTRVEMLKEAEVEIGEVLPKLREIVRRDVPALEKELDRIGAPHTPGRIP
jgi:hypothetical protein